MRRDFDPVFVTGGTGYVGRPLIEALLARRHIVHARRILRPWYVLGPGHRWPYALLPVYAVLRSIRKTRNGAERLGLVTRRAMIAALVHAIETPSTERMRVLRGQTFVVLPASSTDCDSNSTMANRRAKNYASL